LNKDQRLRFHDMADVRIEIDEVDEPPKSSEKVERASRRKERIVLFSALGLISLVAVLMTIVAFRAVPEVSEVRLEINTPPTTNADSLAISPDGKQIAFVAASEGQPRLWLRPLDSMSARPLGGTDSASLPFWSPDNKAVGFFADGKLKRIDINGGSVQIV